MADGADSTGSTTALGGLAGSGTGQTAEPGLNPTGAAVEGNDTTLVNEGTGAKGFVSDEAKAEKKAAAEAKAEERGMEVKGEGTYDAATGAVHHGTVEVTDGNGVTVTKTRA